MTVSKATIQLRKYTTAFQANRVLHNPLSVYKDYLTRRGVSREARVQHSLNSCFMSVHENSRLKSVPKSGGGCCYGCIYN